MMENSKNLIRLLTSEMDALILSHKIEAGLVLSRHLTLAEVVDAGTTKEKEKFVELTLGYLEKYGFDCFRKKA